MKRTLLLTLVLLISTALFAQNRASLLSEHFNESGLPEGWTIAENGIYSWSVTASNKAGGEANELKLYYYPDFNGISRMVMTPVNLTGTDEVVVSFKHCLDNFSGSHIIGIATSSDGVTWNEGWSQSYNTSGTFTVNETISTPDMGKDNVLFCLYYEGNNYNINNWYFDDIEILIQENIDLKLSSIDIPSIIPIGPLTAYFTVQNLGASTVESFKIKAAGEEFSFETNLASFEKKQFSFPVPLNTDNPGTYNIPINIIEVNGTSDDDYSNNEASKRVDVAMGHTQRIPMIEHFSSSTCPPCVAVNYAMTQLTANNPGKYTYTKYPVNWPGDGDPYYTDEVGTRVDYYAVGAAPQTFLDGADQGFTSISQDALDTHYNNPAFANVKGAFKIDGNTINIIADFMAYANMDDVRAYISVNEKTTTGNTGSNGETEFHHIMMKMFEDGNGNAISIKAGEYKRLEFSHSLSSTHIEEMSDIEVSLWLQNHTTKEIYNSHFALENADHCYPVQNHQMTENGNNLQVTWEAPETGTPTAYNVYLNNELVMENTTEMSYTIENNGELYIVEVVAVYGDNTSVGTISTNMEETGPCTAPTNLNATVEQDVEGSEYNFKVTLSWDAVEDAIAYDIKLDGEHIAAVDNNTYVIYFDQEGEHNFAVATQCFYGNSEYSETFNFEVKGESIEELDGKFEIYPNPAKDYIKLSAVGCQLSAVRIYNCLGMLVEEIEMNSNEVEINTSDYNTGIYFISIETENGNVTKKMIVE